MQRHWIYIPSGAGNIVTNPLDPDDPNQPPPPTTAPTPGLGGGGVIVGGGSGGSTNPYPGQFVDSNGNPISDPNPIMGNESGELQDVPDNRIAWQFTSQFAINGGTRIRSWVVGPYAATLTMDRAETEISNMPGLPLAEIWLETYTQTEANGGFTLENGGLISFPYTQYASHRGALYGVDDATGQLMVSSDNAATWSAVANQPPSLDTTGVRIAGTYGTLTVFGGDTVYQTRDQGATWTTTVINADAYSPLDLAPGETGSWAAATTDTVSISTDDGVSWITYTTADLPGFSGFSFNGVAWAGQTLIALNASLQVFRFSGGIWQAPVDVSASSGTIISNSNYDYVAMLGAEEEVLIVGVGDQQFNSPTRYAMRSSDAGVSWQEVTF